MIVIGPCFSNPPSTTSEGDYGGCPEGVMMTGGGGPVWEGNSEAFGNGLWVFPTDELKDGVTYCLLR